MALLFTFLTGCASNVRSSNIVESDFGSQHVRSIQYADHKSFFISKHSEKSLPLIVLIQGSGCDSLFVKDKSGAVHTTSLLGIVGPLFAGRAHIMTVEKPGVSLFSSPNNSGTTNCSDEFKQNFTITNWVKILSERIEFASKLPVVDKKRIVVIGHSEGGEVAAYLAEAQPLITDVVALSLGGTGQLFDFVTFAQKSAEQKKSSSQKAVDEIVSEYKTIEHNPMSYEKFAWGHTYKYWADKFPKRAFESLKRSRARLFVAQGANDHATPIEAFDFLISDLLAAHREFTYLRVDGADHDYSTKSSFAEEGFSSLFKHIDHWLSL